MKILSKILTIISLLLVSSIAVAAQESKCPTATQGVYNLPAGQSLLYATETCFWDTFQGAKYKQKDNAVGFLKAMLSKATTPMTKSLINARIGWLHTWESTEFEVFASYNTKSSSLLNYEATKHFLVSYELNQGPISTSIGTQKLSALTISKGKKYGLPKCRWQRESCDNSSSPWDYVNPQLYNATVEGFVSGFLPLIPYNSFLKHQVPTGQVTASNNTAFFNISTPTLVAVNLNKLGKTNKDKT
ncbi:MAG: hypothetical protein HRT35_27760, partial [Algicola sp.]|nr:hypothetical protein [Algicola sp.]